MRRWYLGFCGCLGLVLAQTGCEPPEGVTNATPPGTVFPKTPPPGEEPAEAIGEAGVASGKIQGDAAPKAEPMPPALPTAKGETKTTKGGVKYETLKQGTGEELKTGAVAEVQYEGKLEDGTIFDSSRKRGEPMKAVLGAGHFIRGWEEALPGMKVGEVRKLFVPAALAYGDQRKGTIPPNSNLIFEVELVRIVR
ncbi:MAG: FKBP-type peptidyl-prolyl cis-trans isomerase [Isosphaeraceae bacterium]